MKQQNLETVDLELPSGTLWMKCNIGAEKETDYGKYFQWGDTEGRYADEIVANPCNWRTCQISGNPQSDTSNADYFDEHKYEFVNSDGILLPKHDAAFMNTHGLMRMPTKEQFEELLAHTTVTWEENFNGSGVNGLKFKSLKDSSKLLFLIANGFISNYTHQREKFEIDLWLSQIGKDPLTGLGFVHDVDNSYLGQSYSAYYGHGVRGVCTKTSTIEK